MKPDPGRFLEIAAQQLLGSIGPALPAGYAQSSVGLLATLVSLRSNPREENP